MLKRIRKRHHFMIRYTGAILKKSLKRPVFIYMIILSGSLMTIFSGVFYLIEGGSNPQVQNLFDAFYFVIGTMTGGGGSRMEPNTSLGKVFAMALMLMGTAIFVAFTAVLASLLIDIELEMEDLDKGDST